MSDLGYARVSTVEQHLDRQTDALEAAGCWRVWAERESGGRDDRPVLREVLDELRPGDVLVVQSLDRLGRSLQHLIQVVGEIEAKGAGLRVLQQGIDTTTAGGRLMFHVMGALAEFERALIRERTLDGLAAARARGRVGGRPPALSAEQVAVVREMRAAGRGVAEIARVMQVGRATVYRHLEPAG